MRNVPSLETVNRDYASKNVKFYFIYKALAHPETNGYVTPVSQDERLAHVKEAERRLGSSIPWLCDTMSNVAKHSLGNAPNSEFVIDPQGVVVKRRAWSDPAQLRRDLEQLVGPVEHVTQVADLDLKTIPPPKAAATGIVPRLKLNGRFTPLNVEPVESNQPFYVKLRAEADESLLKTGKGNLYVGFLLDPLYHVHWNNLVAPIRFEVQSSSDIKVSPASGSGPEVKVAADIDPREFLIAIESPANSPEPLQVQVHYFACNDDEGWCKPVTQQFLVHRKADPDGGKVQSRGRPTGNQKKAAGKPFARAPADTETQFAGIIADVESSSQQITLETRSGDERSFVIDKDSAIMRNGKAGQFAELQVGDRVMVEVKKPTDTTSLPVAIHVRAKEP